MPYFLHVLRGTELPDDVPELSTSSLTSLFICFRATATESRPCLPDAHTTAVLAHHTPRLVWDQPPPVITHTTHNSKSSFNLMYCPTELKIKPIAGVFGVASLAGLMFQRRWPSGSLSRVSPFRRQRPSCRQNSRLVSQRGQLAPAPSCSARRPQASSPFSQASS